MVNVDIDGLAANLSAIVLENQLPWMEGTFGLVLIAVAKYLVWPIVKKYVWEKLVLKCKYKFLFLVRRVSREGCECICKVYLNKL